MSSFYNIVTSTRETQTMGEEVTGRVKWFNNKAGYGFITVTDGHRSGTDVFVHHSSIVVTNQQYKYLVQGEYVEFLFTATQGGDHAYIATNVTGIKKGCLMCETINEFKNTRFTKISQDTVEVEPGSFRYAQRMNDLRPQQLSVSNRRDLRENNRGVPGAPMARNGGSRYTYKKDWAIVDAETKFEHSPSI